MDSMGSVGSEGSGGGFAANTYGAMPEGLRISRFPVWDSLTSTA